MSDKVTELSVGILLGLVRDNLDSLFQSAAANEPGDVATAEAALGYLDDLEKALNKRGNDAA